MGKKTQINYRIDEELLKEIKTAASREGKPYTQWINEACLQYLNKPPITEELYQDLYKRLKTEILAELRENQLTREDTPQEDNRAGENQAGLTNAQLAREIGIDPSTVSRWSTQKRKPPEDLQYKFDPALKLWIKHET